MTSFTFPLHAVANYLYLQVRFSTWWCMVTNASQWTFVICTHPK